MVRYLAVLMPDDAQGSWCAHLPDFAECEVRSSSADVAIRGAAEIATRAARRYRAQGRSMPRPRTLEQIRADDGFAAQRGLDWSRAVISVINVPL